MHALVTALVLEIGIWNAVWCVVMSEVAVDRKCWTKTVLRNMLSLIL